MATAAAGRAGSSVVGAICGANTNERRGAIRRAGSSASNEVTRLPRRERTAGDAAPELCGDKFPSGLTLTMHSPLVGSAATAGGAGAALGGGGGGGARGGGRGR